jgi:hypothetical protein
MPPAIAGKGQMELLDWQPPSPTRRFDDNRVRSSKLKDRLALAVAATLKDADGRGLYREEIARKMSDFLGERVSTNMLNAYASQAREDHAISVPRLMALVHATGDQRLLELIAEPLGFAVVERRFLQVIELAAVQSKADELDRRAKELRARAKSEGAL